MASVADIAVPRATACSYCGLPSSARTEASPRSIRSGVPAAARDSERAGNDHAREHRGCLGMPERGECAARPCDDEDKIRPQAELLRMDNRLAQRVQCAGSITLHQTNAGDGAEQRGMAGISPRPI